MQLKEIRKRHNLTQTQVAEYLNTTQQTYSDYENKKTQPSIETLVKLADLFRTSIDYLIGRVYENDIGYLTPQQIECVSMVKQLNETNLIKAIGYLSAMISMQ